MAEHRIERPGSEVVYTVSGSGPPIVFGHSLLCNRSMWESVIEALELTHTCINVGLRGHGESSATTAFTLWDLADDWLAILDAEGHERAVLCGLSTGGMTAMRVASVAPERVAGLALVDTDPNAEASLFKRVQYRALGDMYRVTGIIPVRTVARSMFGPRTLRSRRELVDALIALMRTFDRKQLARTMKAVFGRDSVDVSTIKAPTLVVVGEHDVALPVGRSKRLAEAIDGAHFEVIADAGHLTAVEQPDELSRLLLEFLPRCA